MLKRLIGQIECEMYSKTQLPTKDKALKGRETPLAVESAHFVNQRSIFGPFPDGLEYFYVGMGCFWGAERKFWNTEGVYVTAVGYGAGITKNPTYEEVCSGGTGHTEMVLIVFDPKITSFEKLLRVFFENHDPTQGMKQGGDIGTQYRSGIYVINNDQKLRAQSVLNEYQLEISKAGFGTITTEIIYEFQFYYAETYHQQYLAKNPNGYCGLGGLGIVCPIGLNI